KRSFRRGSSGAQGEKTGTAPPPNLVPLRQVRVVPQGADHLGPSVASPLSGKEMADPTARIVTGGPVNEVVNWSSPQGPEPTSSLLGVKSPQAFQARVNRLLMDVYRFGERQTGGGGGPVPTHAELVALNEQLWDAAGVTHLFRDVHPSPDMREVAWASDVELGLAAEDINLYDRRFKG